MAHTLKRTTILVFAALISLVIANGALFAQIPPEEREALIALYEATDGDTGIRNIAQHGLARPEPNLPCLFLFREISIRLSQPSFLHLLRAEFSANGALR